MNNEIRIELQSAAKKFLNIFGDENDEILMAELNRNELPGITNYAKLVERWTDSPMNDTQGLRGQIEARMSELNRECSDYAELMKRRKISIFGFRPWIQIEIRMTEIINAIDLTKELPLWIRPEIFLDQTINSIVPLKSALKRLAQKILLGTSRQVKE